MLVAVERDTMARVAEPRSWYTYLAVIYGGYAPGKKLNFQTCLRL